LGHCSYVSYYGEAANRARVCIIAFTRLVVRKSKGPEDVVSQADPTQ
jgi:hypothetical protein